jgi:hypothetical protein
MIFFFFNCLCICAYSQNKGELLLNEQKKIPNSYHVGMQKVTSKYNYNQIAQKFESGKKLKNLISLTLYRQIIDYPLAIETDYYRTKFKINVFSIDTISGRPGESLIPGGIEINDEYSKKIKVDFRKYNIRLNDKGFFISIEYLKTDYNLRLSPIPVEDLSKINLMPMLNDLLPSFQPFLTMSDVKGNKNNVWVIDETGKWSLYDYFYPDLTDLAISAVVTY